MGLRARADGAGRALLLFPPGEHGEQVIVADDVDHYLYQPTLALPYREPSGLETDHEAILALQTHAQRVPRSFRVADYHPEGSPQRVKADANLAYEDPTTYGEPYVYGTGHLDDTQAQ